MASQKEAATTKRWQTFRILKPIAILHVWLSLIGPILKEWMIGVSATVQWEMMTQRACQLTVTVGLEKASQQYKQTSRPALF